MDSPVTCDNGSRVDLVPDKFVCTTQKFGSDQYDRGGSISDFLVLLSSQRYEDSSLYMSIRSVCDTGYEIVIMFELTAGCATSSSDRIVAPSFVIVTSPTLSTNILSRLER